VTRRFFALWFAVALAIGGTAAWYLFTHGAPPPGQPALGSETDFRQAFARGVDRSRIVALLSPSVPEDLRLAHLLQALLMEYETNQLEAHIVWNPAAGFDVALSTDAMGRVWDTRARHYWDKTGNIRAEYGPAHVLLYSRGAGLSQPAVKVIDWERDLPQIRKFLGPPASGQPQP
jgi:hypothetical protein